MIKEQQLHLLIVTGIHVPLSEIHSQNVESELLIITLNLVLGTGTKSCLIGLISLFFFGRTVHFPMIKKQIISDPYN